MSYLLNRLDNKCAIVLNKKSKDALLNKYKLNKANLISAFVMVCVWRHVSRMYTNTIVAEMANILEHIKPRSNEKKSKYF